MNYFTKKKSSETHPLTWRINDDYQHPIWINDYKKKNGYMAAKKAIIHMSPNEIVNIITDSKLSGRGGAGFPTGIKWNALLNNSKENCIRYLICNADEMEPGTYKDRFLMENLPHLLIEGIIIASYALRVSKSYIFLRDDYIKPRMYLNQAISEAKKHKLLGKNILNTEFNLEIILHTGAGRYICGEETALINSLEGYRANPRSKPPFPANFGIWGKPTCINNVETLCNVPPIIENGVHWYKSLSINDSKDQGTKLMGFSGKVKCPGIWELPFGTLAREIFENYAKGMQSNLILKAWQPGGAGTGFLTEKHLDIPMDFIHLNKIGSRLGTAISIAIDNTISIVSITKNLEEFFSRESCGWCTPCRDGLSWSVKILQDLENKNGKSKDIEMLEELCDFLGPGKTFCAHAQGAAAPLKSAIKYFRSEFNAGIKN